MKIIRYSVDGFKPQFQVHHIHMYVNYHLFKFNLEAYPEDLKRFCKESHDVRYKLYRDNFDDFQRGIWVFIDGYKDRQSLNHLNKLVPCWSAEISDDTIGYDCNWEKKIKITDNTCKFGGIYIPENQLYTISNIQRVKKAA